MGSAISNSKKPETTRLETRKFKRKANVAIWRAAFVAVALLLIWYAADLLLLTFLSVLFAIFLDSLATPMAQRLRIPERVAIWVVVVILMAIVWGLGVSFSNDVAKQFEELVDKLPKAADKALESIGSTELGRQFLQQTSRMEKWLQPSGMVSRATGFLTVTVGFVSSAIYVLTLGFFLAYSPREYVVGCVRLMHPRRRQRALEVMRAIGQSMRLWILGKLASMVFIGLVTCVGLYLIGVQLALVLALLAGALAFIPFIGPTLAAAPALILALVEGPQTAAYVLGLYVGIQVVEGNILTPLIEKRTVQLPPALTIFSQLFASILFGFMGMLTASPLTAVGMILVRMLYIEDVLEAENGDD